MQDDVIDSVGECKPAIDAGDAAELIRAKRAQSTARLKQLLKFHRDRGVSNGEILSAMAGSPQLVDAIGPGRRRERIARVAVKWPQQP